MIYLEQIYQGKAREKIIEILENNNNLIVMDYNGNTIVLDSGAVETLINYYKG